ILATPNDRFPRRLFEGNMSRSFSASSLVGCGLPTQPDTYAVNGLGNFNAGLYMPNLATGSGIGQGGGDYAGFSQLSLLSCSASFSPGDPACWGVRVIASSQGFTGSWSVDNALEDERRWDRAAIGGSGEAAEYTLQPNYLYEFS